MSTDVTNGATWCGGEVNARALVDAALRQRLNRLHVAIRVFAYCHTRFGEPRIFEGITAMLQLAGDSCLLLKGTSESSRAVMLWFSLRVARDVCRDASRTTTVAVLLAEADDILEAIERSCLDLECRALEGSGAGGIA